MLNNAANDSFTFTEFIAFLQRFPQNASVMAFLEQELIFQIFWSLILPALKGRIPTYKEKLPRELQQIKNAQSITALRRIANSEDIPVSAISRNVESSVTEFTTLTNKAILDNIAATENGTTSEDATASEDTTTSEDATASEDTTTSEDATALEDTTTLEDTTALKESNASSMNSPVHGNSPTPLMTNATPRESEAPENLEATVYTMIDGDILASSSENFTSPRYIENHTNYTTHEDTRRLTSSFPLWISQPSEFWKQSAEGLQFKDNMFKANVKLVFNYSNTKKSKLQIQSLQYRFISVIAYFTYVQMAQKQIVTLQNVKEILLHFDIPIEEAENYKALLTSGRRRVDFCQQVCSNEDSFARAQRRLAFCQKFCPSEQFIDLSPLFLPVNDEMWERQDYRNKKKFNKYVAIFRAQNVVTWSQESGAYFVQRSIIAFCLQYIGDYWFDQMHVQVRIHGKRPAPIDKDVTEHSQTVANVDKRPASPNNREIDTAAATFNVGEGNTPAATFNAGENHSTTTPSDEECNITAIMPNGEGSNTKVISKRSHVEAELDVTTASKRSCTEANLGTSATKRARTGDDWDGTRVLNSTESGFDASESLEFVRQSATATEAAAVGLDSGPLQSNIGLSSNFESVNTCLGQRYVTPNMVDTHDDKDGDVDSSEPLHEHFDLSDAQNWSCDEFGVTFEHFDLSDAPNWGCDEFDVAFRNSAYYDFPETPLLDFNGQFTEGPIAR
ncbi:hypothetical protein V8C35DRAFT_294233 [Trichoderma chlorosporum]